MVRTVLVYSAILIIALGFFASMVVWGIPALQESSIILPSVSAAGTEGAGGEKDRASINAEIENLKTKFDKFTPTGAYFVVNTTENHFYLYKGKQLIREGICSTGKNEKLVSADSSYSHEFYTPFGVRKILRKATNPIWKKPDWAYIEEGLPVPGANDPSRWEEGTLGAYKLEIGDGYMIHGTIYKRRMGMSVTHGCIRLLDDDLEAVYKTMEVGSKVYIY